MADDAIRRAAGVMLWHLQQGHDSDEAVAKASAREPHLSEQELSYALDWASNGIDFAEMCSLAPPETDLWELAKRAGLPVPEGEEDG